MVEGLRPIFALFSRSLLVEWRSNFTHFARLGVGALVFVMLVSVHEQSVWFGAPGRMVLEWLGYMNAFLIMMAGASYFATSIAEEKEERILGLLRMTSLNSVAILLGKSTSRLVSTAVLIVVQLPFFFLVIPLGGVAMNQVSAVAVALLGYLALASGVGVFFSVIFTRAWRATLCSLLTLGLLWLLAAIGFDLGWLTPVVSLALSPVEPFAPDAVAATLDWLSKPHVSDFFVSCSVHSRIGEILYSDPTVLSVTSKQLWIHLVSGLVLFLLAWWAFDVLRRDEPQEGTGLISRWIARLRNRPRKRALYWSAFHFSAWGYLVLILRALFYGLVVMICAEGSGLNNYGRIRDYGYMFVTIGYLGTFCEFGFIGERLIRPEIKSGTLPTILMLPMTVGQVIRARLLGFLPGLIPALLLIVSGFTMTGFRDFRRMDPEDLIFMTFFVCLPFVYLFVVTWLSLFLRWGSSLAGVVVGGVTGTIFAGTMFLSGSGEEATVFCWDLIFVGFMIWSLLWIPRRVMKLGASS